jgi:cold shock CspA family protein
MGLKELFSKSPDEPENLDEIDDSIDSEEPKRRFKGKIIHVNEDKGWGFITTPEIRFVRIFFHWTALRPDTLNFKELKKGMKVEFSIIELPGRGVRAIKVGVIDSGE